ncbi:MAG TPA: nitroreductase family protein [Candidatus Limnocylindrales bacterium]|nr:nitroreductase family protein [Candidatus Limnocylindrales bacterium]
MDVLDAIHGLRVVRRFADRPIEPAHLDTILNAGRRASSSKNQQRWDFIVVTDRDRLRALGEVGAYAGHLAGAAAAIALVTPDPRGPDQPLSVLWDLGLASQNMILAAWALGIGSCPATVYDADLARRLLGYPADRTCEYLLSLGYPADPETLTRPLRRGGRRPLAEIVHHERW